MIGIGHLRMYSRFALGLRGFRAEQAHVGVRFSHR
jgi:hypothetical protein